MSDMTTPSPAEVPPGHLHIWLERKVQAGVSTVET